MKYKNLMAKALYDNMPESPEELAFRKGDILTVIEQNTGGLEGWWLCSLHGRQGIAPGNRLKLLIGPMFDGQTPAASPPQLSAYQGQGGVSQGQGLYQVPPSHPGLGQQGIYQVPQGQDVYQVPQRSVLAVDGAPSKVVTPSRVGQSYAYSHGQHSHQDLYDVPPARAQGVYDVGKAQPGSGLSQGVYDVPPSSQMDPRAQGVYDVPPSSQMDPRAQGVYDVPPSSQMDPRAQGVYDVPPSSQMDPRAQGVYDVPPSSQMDPRAQGVYDVPPSSQMDPRAQGVYDIPPSSQVVFSSPPCRNAPAESQEGSYDFPQPLKHRQEGIYDVPPPALSKPCQTPSPQSHYDLPPSSDPTPLHPPLTNDNEGIYDVPPSSQPLAACPHKDLYDIPRGPQPPQHRPPASDRARGPYELPAQDAGALGDVTDGVNRLSFSSTGSTRSSMSTSSTSTGSSEGRLALDLDTAVQRLGRLQQEVEVSVEGLLAGSPRWRACPGADRPSEVRGALDRVRGALGDFLVFGRGAAANATALSDPSLHAKLRRQLGRLEDSQQILLKTYQTLESCGWALPSQGPCNLPRHHKRSDDLERFVMVSRTVPDDVKQLASTVGGSGELLFRRPGDGSCCRGSVREALVHPLTSPPTDNHHSCHTKAFQGSSSLDKGNMDNSEKCVKSWMEDYDYVHLQGKEDFERQQKALLEKENITQQSSKCQLGPDQINQFRQLEQEVIKPVENDITQWITQQQSTGPSPLPSDSSPPASDSSPSSLGGGAHLCGHDHQLLAFYSEQCQQHFITLLNAVDAFFACVSAGQPPRIFVAHSKFVILSAHKLVFIGDTLSRQAATPQVANRVMNSSNVLCELLKTVVGATKTAALLYPNTAAVQDMVDRVSSLSHHARLFKQQLLHMAAF
ncbi:enhancer of filamentation 1 isoform X2 [Hypomesus transpacificus]|uniref:enhancer of filamentation 1 isoform X2 n=1 Tax=Hypomesus transpacificus TaxID=137520 RepID=UPI001F086915|nr:enhancer of filamentation 1 isoform X2 [Hypomesus transpacificus]